MVHPAKSTMEFELSGAAQPTDNIQSLTAIAATARALATYSLVPYLGILFCPGAVLMGSLGVFRSYRSRQSNVRTSSLLSIGIGMLVFVIQILLWWIMYKVPEWAQGR